MADVQETRSDEKKEDEDGPGKLVFLHYDQDSLDLQYEHARRLTDIPVWRAKRVEASERVRGTFESRLDVAYGDDEDEDEKLDIFPAKKPGSPIRVWVHGGAWTAGTRKEFSYPAEAFVNAGAAFVVIGFGLTPKVTLDQIVDQVRRAVAWVYHNAESLGGDRDRLFMSSHSSGSHLTAMTLATDWSKHDMPADAIKGAVMGSGIYDLRPIKLSYRNQYLDLDDEAVDRLSPVRHIPDVGCPLTLAIGGDETEDFFRQRDEYAAAWRAKGHPYETIERPCKHHFSITIEYGDAEGPIVKAALGQMGL